MVKARGIHCSLSRLFIVVRKGHVAGCFLHILQARALWEPCGEGVAEKEHLSLVLL